MAAAVSGGGGTVPGGRRALHCVYFSITITVGNIAAQIKSKTKNRLRHRNQCRLIKCTDLSVRHIKFTPCDKLGLLTAPLSIPQKISEYGAAVVEDADWRKNRGASRRRTYPSATLFTTNPTQNDLNMLKNAQHKANSFPGRILNS